MKIFIHDTPKDVFSQAANILHAKIRSQPNAVLGLATGGTMLRVYAQLVSLISQSGTSLSKIITFNLDEYVGLAPEHPASFHNYMQENLFSKVDIDPENTHLLRGDIPDPEQVSLRYEALIKEVGGIDLQLLGIGRNGHIGFNEPSSSLTSRTRLKTLAKSTHDANLQYFEGADQMPKCAMTMGVGTILDSRECLLVAIGEHKAKAVADMVEGPVTASCPASALQFHQNMTVLIDSDAAAKLQMRTYYRPAQGRSAEIPGPNAARTKSGPAPF